MASEQIHAFPLSDGTTIPWLALGNGSGRSRDNALSACTTALEAGINHIDTAQIYRTESETKEAIDQSRVPRSHVYVTSKIFSPYDTKEEIRASIEESIKKLGGVPNLFLIHNPFVGKEQHIVPTWQVMEDMKDEGRLQSIGVSNFRPQDFERLLKECRHKPVVHQLEYHPFVLKHLEPVLKIHKEHGILVESYGPLTPTLRHPEQGGPLKPVLDKIAGRLSQATGEQLDANAVLLLWCRAKNAVAVTTSADPGRIRGLAKIARLQENLTPQEVEEIDDIGKQYHLRYYAEHMSTEFPEPDLPASHIFPGRK